MKLSDIRQIPAYKTKAIDEAEKKCQAIEWYTLECLQKMWKGIYGSLTKEELKINEQQLHKGEGRIVCLYPRIEDMSDDLCIVCNFSKKDPQNKNKNMTMIMYASEF